MAFVPCHNMPLKSQLLPNLNCSQNSKVSNKKSHSLWKLVPPQNWCGIECFTKEWVKEQFLLPYDPDKCTCSEHICIFAVDIWKAGMTELPGSRRMRMERCREGMLTSQSIRKQQLAVASGILCEPAVRSLAFPFLVIFFLLPSSRSFMHTP